MTLEQMGHLIRELIGTCQHSGIVREDIYPASVTIAQRELYEMTVKFGDKTFQINVQEVRE